jgi:hypothetical protein
MVMVLQVQRTTNLDGAVVVLSTLNPEAPAHFTEAKGLNFNKQGQQSFQVCTFTGQANEIVCLIIETRHPRKRMAPASGG